MMPSNKPAPISKEVLTELYLNKRLSIEAISRLHKFTQRSISLRIKELELARRAISGDPVKGTTVGQPIIDSVSLAQMLRAGESMGAICSRFGKTAAQVTNACNRRFWPLPQHAGVSSFSYDVRGLKPLPKEAPPPPPADSIEATGGKYTKIAAWAAANNLPTTFALQQWHRVRSSVEHGMGA